MNSNPVTINNFTANSPPEWLRQDMTLASGILPDIKVRVVFHDDLPTENRKMALLDMLEASWPGIADKTPYLPRLLKIADYPNGGGMEDDSLRKVFKKACPVSGGPAVCFRPLSRPRHAVMLLPNRSLSGADFTRFYTGLGNAYPTTAISLRGIFWHEFGHLQTACLTEQTIRDRIDEKCSNLNVAQGCNLSGDKTTSEHFRDCCTLMNLVSGITPFFSLYWHPLSLHGINATEANEMASVLELKARTKGLLPRTSKATSFIRKVMIDPVYDQLRQGFSSISRAEPVLTRLAKIHETRSYVFPHSHDLAEKVFASARRLSPDPFRVNARI